MPALRTIAAYRTTVSFEAALLLARIPPLHLTAAMYKRIYEYAAEIKTRGDFNLEAVRSFGLRERAGIRRSWMAYVRREGLPGARIRDAIIRHFDEWMDRRTGFLTFRITQFLTGHGCFGRYLFRIGKEDTSICPYCQDGEDTADHTVRTCDAWVMERSELRYVVGPDLSLPALVGAICQSKEKWIAFSTFAERI